MNTAVYYEVHHRAHETILLKRRYVLPTYVCFHPCDVDPLLGRLHVGLSRSRSLKNWDGVCVAV